MIELTDINKVFRTDEVETRALDSINIKIDKGEFVSIMGPSGCGKSTLLNIMGLLDTPTSGTVYLDNIEISGKKDKEMAKLRNKKIGFIFQNFHLISTLNVFDNVELPLLYGKEQSRTMSRNKVKEVLEKVSLSHRMRHYPTQLSGGQCQRVAIARAIIGNPCVLLADEPTGNLDSKMGKEILELLMRLNAEGATIVMVTHDEKIAKQTNRIIQLYDGKLVE